MRGRLEAQLWPRAGQERAAQAPVRVLDRVAVSNAEPNPAGKVAGGRRDEVDDLRAARGIFASAGLGICLWVVILLLLFFVRRLW